MRGGIELAGERPGAACTSADIAVELDERLPSGWELRGDCLSALGEHATAVTSYDRAVNLAEGTVAERALKRKLAGAQRKANKK